jgi:hypothetical protein
MNRERAGERGYTMHPIPVVPESGVRCRGKQESPDRLMHIKPLGPTTVATLASVQRGRYRRRGTDRIKVLNLSQKSRTIHK